MKIDTPREKLEAIGRIIDQWRAPEPDEGWPEGEPDPSTVIDWIQSIADADHAAEVERLRAENERLSTELHHAKGEAERLRRYVEQFIEPVDRAREAAIYGAAFVREINDIANAKRCTTTADLPECIVIAEQVVKAWRAAQKGGDDG